MTTWSAQLGELELVLAEWEAFATDPAEEPLPLEAMPALPAGPAPDDQADRVRALLHRIEAMQARLADYERSLHIDVRHVRKLRTAMDSYGR